MTTDTPNPVKSMRVIRKSDGEELTAIYSANRLGNMRYNVDGRFYSDREFDKLFDKVEDKLVWRSHLRNMFDEVLTNTGMWIFYQPFRITMAMLGEMAAHAAKSGDEKMIGYFCRLSLYEFSDPTHKDYDKERTEYYINKTR